MWVESTQVHILRTNHVYQMLGHLCIFSNKSDGKLKRAGGRTFGESSKRGQAKTTEEETIRGDQNWRNYFKEEEEETKAYPNGRFTW